MSENEGPIFSVLNGKGTITVSGAGTEVLNGTYSISGTYNGYDLYVAEHNQEYRIAVYSSFIPPNVGFQENWIIGRWTGPPGNEGWSPVYYAIPRNGTSSPPLTGWYVVNGTAPAPTLS